MNNVYFKLNKNTKKYNQIYTLDYTTITTPQYARLHYNTPDYKETR